MKTYTSLNFSPTEEDCLIDEVSKYPALYDAESRDHKDVTLKSNIWKMISEKLNNKSIQDCQKKWKNIRDSYMRFRRRKLKAGCSSIESLPESSRYARLAFLDNIKYDRIMHHSLNGVEDSNFMCTPEETSNNDVETIQEKYQSNKRKALEEIFIEDLDDKPLPTLNHSFSSKPEDEIDYFMCSLANSIKKFSPDLKRNIKIDLLRLVNEYEKKHENESSKQAYFPAYS